MTLGVLTPKQIDVVLHRATVGRIGVSDEHRTYVVPMTFVYDGDSVYGHTTLGQKVAMMRRNANVGFEVDEIHDLANWRSVIAQGRYEELSGDLAEAAARLIAARLAPITTSQTAGPAGSGRARSHIVFRIQLLERTGRFERRTSGRRKEERDEGKQVLHRGRSRVLPRGAARHGRRSVLQLRTSTRAR